MIVPETRYVSVGDADVAYQIVGEGPIDLVAFWGLGTQLDLEWDQPKSAEALNRLASFSRLIRFDRRGTAASDRRLPGHALPAWEEWAEDISAVLDIAGSEQAAIAASRDAGPMAIMFAAVHPERVRALVLVATSARWLVADDYPFGYTSEALEEFVEFTEANWGTPGYFQAIGLAGVDDPDHLQAELKMARAAATPRTAAAQFGQMFAADVRAALPLIQAPTLVIHPTNAIVPIEHGRYLARHIKDATLLERPGSDLGVGPSVDDIVAFVTGERPAVDINRVLTTILFTDIVGSTQWAADMGDEKWCSLLDAHDLAVREQLRRFRGREINTTGDGFYASFDGPGRAIGCALAIADSVRALGLEVRAGLHTGECEVRGDDLSGLAVNIAARVGNLADSGEVLVSSTIRDLVIGSGINFNDRGEYGLKGVPGQWRLLAVDD